MEIKASSKDYEQIEKLNPDQIPQLRKILQGKHNITVPTQCDEFLARCIRMENGNIENAIKLVMAYHTATGDFPSWDAIFQPSRNMEAYYRGELMILSQRNHEGRIVFIGRVGMWDPDQITSDHVMACAWMLFQFVTANSMEVQRNGIVAIFDFAGVSMKHTWAVNKRRIPAIVKLVQNHTVGTINEFHAINHPKIFRIFFSTFIKPFLRESLQKWIFFHDNIESLHSQFDKNVLPKFLGGDHEVEECMDWEIIKKFLGQDQYYKDMMNDRFPRY